VAQGVGPELKPQYYIKKKKKRPEEKGLEAWIKPYNT
jgi:hypothetical protein